MLELCLVRAKSSGIMSMRENVAVDCGKQKVKPTHVELVPFKLTPIGGDPHFR